MIILIRVFFAAGLLLALGYAAAYLWTGKRAHLVNAFRALIVTLVLALLFFAGMFIERLTA